MTSGAKSPNPVERGPSCKQSYFFPSTICEACASITWLFISFKRRRFQKRNASRLFCIPYATSLFHLPFGFGQLCRHKNRVPRRVERRFSFGSQDCCEIPLTISLSANPFPQCRGNPCRRYSRVGSSNSLIHLWLTEKSWASGFSRFAPLKRLEITAMPPVSARTSRRSRPRTPLKPSLLPSKATTLSMPEKV